MTEPRITINGRLLAEGQAAAVRVAILSFHQDCSDPVALGDDEARRRLTEAYRDRLAEVLHMITGPVPQRMAIDDDRPAQEKMLTGMHVHRVNRILQLAGIVPEQATVKQRDLAQRYAAIALSIDEAAMRLQRAGS